MKPNPTKKLPANIFCAPPVAVAAGVVLAVVGGVVVVGSGVAEAVAIAVDVTAAMELCLALCVVADKISVEFIIEPLPV